MTNLLVKLFVKNPDDVKNAKTRENYGILSGIVGIVCNIILAVSKLIVGTVSGSISITADAVNNLSDAGSSVVTVFGFKAAGKPADDEHPFGHGRLEYICALVVSFLVLLMGFELIKSSIDKIINPSALSFSWPAIVVLLISICVKLWLAFFNRNLGRRIKSPAMEAVVADSLSDTAATAVSMISLIFAAFTDIPLDGYMGIIVALFIFASGIGILKDTVGPLLGESPSPELVKSFEERILSYDGVVGVHDIMIHNYGPNRSFASAHAEVPADNDIMHSHDTIDLIERDIYSEFGIFTVIHLDPIITDDERISELKEIVTEVVKGIDERLSIHDFRVVEGPTHTNIVFDLVKPHKFQMKDFDIKKLIEKKVKEIDENYFTVITFEYSYINA